MTIVYFMKHAEPNKKYNNLFDLKRELAVVGLQGRERRVNCEI